MGRVALGALVAALLFGCGTPRERTPEERVAALSEVSDPHELASIAIRERDPEVGKAAVARLNDQGELGRVAANARFPAALSAAKKLTDQAALARAVRSEEVGIRRLVIKRIEDQALILRLAETDPSLLVRFDAIGRIDDPAELARLAKTPGNTKVRLAAIARVEDTATLQDIVLNERVNFQKTNKAYAAIRVAAFRRVRDQEALATLYLASEKRMSASEPDQTIVKEAFEQIDDPVGLRRIALESGLVKHQFEAVRRLTDPEQLAVVALQSSNSRLRAIAVSKVTDQEVLERVLLRDGDRDVRNAAYANVTDPELLFRVAIGEGGHRARSDAAKRVQDPRRVLEIALRSMDASKAKFAADRVSDPEGLKKIARNARSVEARRSAVARIDDQELLERITFTDRKVSYTAAERLTDPRALAKVALRHPEESIRLLVIKRVTNSGVLLQVVLQQETGRTAAAAVDRIRDQNMLVQYVLSPLKDNGSNRGLRMRALKRVTDPDLLVRVAVGTEDLGFGTLAVNQIRSQDRLVPVAEKAPLKEVRKLAFRQMEESALADLREKATSGGLRLAMDLRRGARDWKGIGVASATTAVDRRALVDALFYVRITEEVAAELYEFCRVLVEAGDGSTVPILKETVAEPGGRRILELCMNCGQKELSSAARASARKQGYTIVQIQTQFVGNSTVKWKSGG